jgi:Protein of unknown function (DUF3579)
VDHPSSFFILGLTQAGKVFRPSDWADRLCSVMAPYKPGGGGPGAHLTYSPYVMPDQKGDLKCVRVDKRIFELEPLAYKFLVSFATDNDLQIEPIV